VQELAIVREWRFLSNKEYQGSVSAGCNRIASGPLLSDDGTLMIHSAFIYQGFKQEVERIVKEDPFYVNGAWKDVTIMRYFPERGIERVLPMAPRHPQSSKNN
jgi:hypothetical protein